jgi:hypothetical protein
VAVRDPFVQTVAIDYTKGSATLMVGCTIANAAAVPVTGTLRLFVVDAPSVSWEGNITLAAHESREWSSGSTDLLSYPAVLDKLWWPHTHTDKVHLHTMRWAFTANGALSTAPTLPSHTLDHRFGIRTVRNFHDETTAGNGFEVNGQRLYLQGGNWISTDQLLRYTTEPSGGSSVRGRYFNEVCDMVLRVSCVSCYQCVYR